MKTIVKILGYCTILAGLTSCYTGQYVSYSDGIYDEPAVQNTPKITKQRAVKNNHFAKEFDRINILKNNDTIMQTPTYNLDNSNSNVVIYTQPQVNYRGYSRYRFDDFYYDDFYDYTYDDYRNGMWRYRRYNRYNPYWNDGFYFGYRGYYDYSNPYYYGYRFYNPYYYTPHYHQNHHWNSHHNNHHYGTHTHGSNPSRHNYGRTYGYSRRSNDYVDRKTKEYSQKNTRTTRGYNSNRRSYNSNRKSYQTHRRYNTDSSHKSSSYSSSRRSSGNYNSSRRGYSTRRSR